ncbi:MAG: GNAT family N-acetyltransferase [Bacteroidetes bacterium]|nr:GNAT family N-acetyltransferase [Bacteroidota bacterium]
MRPWHPDDATSLVKHANNLKVASNLRDGFPYPYTLADARKWLKMVGENRDDLILAIEFGGEAAGGIGIHAGKDVYRYNGEIGYWLSEALWGRGIMSDAVSTLVDHAFTHTPWLRIFANIFENNTPSMRVLEKNGFIREAIHKLTVMKGGTLLDEHLFALMKKGWEQSRLS